MIGLQWLTLVKEKIRKTRQPIYLTGIGGLMRVDEEIDIWIQQINAAVTVYVLPGDLCPVLSEGKLCIDMGFY